MAVSNINSLRQAEPAPVPALGMSYQFGIVEGVTLVFQTHIDATTDRRDLDDLLDHVAGAAERQKAKIELPEIRRRRDVALKQLEIAERDYVSSQARFEGMAANSNRRLTGITAQQKGTLDNAKLSIERLREEVDRWDSEIAKREDIVHGGEHAGLP